LQNITLMALIRIKNLHVDTYIGFNPEELVTRQDVVVNLTIRVPVSPEALVNDEPDGIYDYKTITKKIITFIRDGRFKLLEVLVHGLLDLVMSDERVEWVRVEADKPGALRFADSVSVEMEACR